MSEYQTIIFEVDGGIAQITLNRPERLNAISYQLMSELDDVLTKIEENPEIRVAILTGGTKCFCAGADIKERTSKQATSMEVYDNFHRSRRVFKKIENLPKPTIAAISGVAMGGGCELALVCDLRIASDTARIGVPEIKIGVIPAAGGTQRLPRLIGAAKAKEMVFMGEPLDAQEAYRVGLVNKVVPVEDLIDEARKWAKVFMERPPLTLKMAKSAINRGLEMNLDNALEYEAQCATLLFSTEDRLEGMEAFVEKRKPLFKGR